MVHQEGHFLSKEGQTLFYQCWQPTTEIKAVVLLVHGLAEHSGRYQAFAEFLIDKGYAIAALDLIGHGQSDGGRTCIKTFTDHRDTVLQFRQLLAKKFSSEKFFILGHSMGGLVATSVLLDYQTEFSGCILSAAALKLPSQPPKIQEWLIRSIAFFLPNLGVLQLDSGDVSRDPEVVSVYLSDPLNHTGKVSARCVAEMFATMKIVESTAHKIKIPILILHGQADNMTAVDGSTELFNSVSSQDKTVHLYPDLYHEILNEPEREQVYRQIGDWLDARFNG